MWEVQSCNVGLRIFSPFLAARLRVSGVLRYGRGSGV